MRMDQATDTYLHYEASHEMEKCWSMLLARLNTYRTEPSDARRRAESLWNSLYWPGDIDGFHTLLRRALTAMRRVHLPLPDHAVVIKYLAHPTGQSQVTRGSHSQAAGWLDHRRVDANYQRAV